jgi:hypothetical protein
MNAADDLAYLRASLAERGILVGDAVDEADIDKKMKTCLEYMDLMNFHVDDEMRLPIKVRTVFRRICALDIPGVTLLRDVKVLQWLFGDASFLKASAAARYAAEEEWVKSVMRRRRPDLEPWDTKTNWTNVFGEHVLEEILKCLHRNSKKPVKMASLSKLNFETDEDVYEVKTQTYFVQGEKIEADAPKLYGKPLKIVCVGGAEKMAREQYDCLPAVVLFRSPGKRKMMDVSFVGASDMLSLILC